MDTVDLLDESLITLSLKATDKYQAIEELLDLLVRAGKVKDRELALKDLIEREQYLSTGLENGLAVPHAKTDAVDTVLLAFGLSRQGIEFESVDGKPAHFIFLVLSPRETSGPHIRILAQITRMFKDPDVPQQMMNAKSPSDIIEIIRSHQ